jgi:hypothetical protein
LRKTLREWSKRSSLERGSSYCLITFALSIQTGSDFLKASDRFPKN